VNINPLNLGFDTVGGIVTELISKGAKIPLEKKTKVSSIT
jgi:molecular chaperone DnaK (HSP70)